jgi:hypothetical protein
LKSLCINFGVFPVFKTKRVAITFFFLFLNYFNVFIFKIKFRIIIINVIIIYFQLKNLFLIKNIMVYSNNLNLVKPTILVSRNQVHDFLD